MRKNPKVNTNVLQGIEFCFKKYMGETLFNVNDVKFGDTDKSI